MKSSKLICSVCAVASAAVMSAVPVRALSGCDIEDTYITHKINCLANDNNESVEERSVKQRIEDSSKAHIGLYACIGGAVLVIAGMVCLIAIGKRK